MKFVISLALAAVAAWQAGESPGGRTATFDVVVTDGSGRVVTSLRRDDFIVKEQGGALSVESSRFVRSTGLPRSPAAVLVSTAQAERPSADADARLFGIVLDEYHITAGPAADRVRDALRRFVTEDLGPRDRVAVLKPLDSLLDIQLTDDRMATVRAIESLAGRRGAFAPQTAFEQNFMASSPQGIAAARVQIATSLTNALAAHLGQFGQVRKTLILVSEGFLPLVRDRANPWLPDFDAVVRSANRAGVAIYPLDPAAHTAQADSRVAENREEDDLRQALRVLARETAGRFMSGDAVEKDLSRMLVDAGGYFALTVRDVHADGRFHAVDVSVRQPGMNVVARRGYWSASASADPALVATARLPSPLAGVARRSSPLIRPWFGMTRAADGTTLVSFVWEPAPRVPGARGVPSTPARIELSVNRLDGTPVFKGVVTPAGGGGTEAAPAQSRASFESPVGRLLVQMAIEDAASRVVDRDVRDLVVGGFPGPLTLGTAEVLRVRNARDYRAVVDDLHATPVAARDFSRTERLLVRLPVFSAAGSADVTARLVSRFGTALRRLDAVRVSMQAPVYQVDVPLGALAAGEYAIEFEAQAAAASAAQRVPFRITP